MRERTTKRVNASLTLTFHGDYVAADEIAGRLDAWIDRGFDDRDDLRGWKLEVQGITEIHGDPDGYDS
jgi:hypothetical protein